MGACCSCQLRGGFDGFYVEDAAAHREVENEDIVFRGHSGAHIRLLGSSSHVSMFTQQGKKGTNQDSMTAWENFSGDKDMYFCAVFDGHGPSGHKVSQYIRDALPAKVSMQYKEASRDGMNGCLDVEVAKGGDGNPELRNPFFLSWKARLTKCFHEMDEELEANSSIESYCSGTTSVCVIKKGEHLVISNLGDSRAVLCTRDGSNHLVAEQLTVDLKPNLPGERQRIKSCHGRVLAMEEESNVYRIWMPHEDCPGLAMARAFGDFCLKDYGVISTPEVTYRKLTQKDEFVVLASDGIWDVLSNEDVVTVVASARKRSLAAKLLIEKAVRTWRYKYPCAKIDDCAVVCLFFKRQRPMLTKSISEVSQISLNYLEMNRYASSMRNDDGLDTVLNCNVNEEGGDNDGDGGIRPRKRRTGKRLHHDGE